MKTVLVTGGTGFLGSNLSLRHLQKGDCVRVAAREATALEAETSAHLTGEGAEVIVGDIADPQLARRAVDGVDLVYHVAAAMREANVPDAHFREVNVHATERLLKFSREAGVGRFVYCGTSGAVGPSHGRRTDEETECHPKDIYQQTKLEAERLALRYGRESGLPVVVVRPAGVYGPGDGRLLKLFRMIGKGWFLMVGNGRGKHHLVYIDDLIDGMELAATREEAVGRCYNLADAEPVPLDALVDLIAAQLGVDCRKIRVPFGPMKLLAVVMDRTMRPLGLQPPLYPRRLDFFKHDEHFGIARARAELGYEPSYSLEDGIRSTVAAYRAAGWIDR